MTTESDLQSMGLMLGELRGQSREMIHQMNNLSSKLDAIAHEVSKSSHLGGEVEKLKERVTVLEDKENQRTGAVNLGAWLLKTPLVAWVAAAGVALWAFLKGHGQ
jgi:predicted RNase H-like nuclease (RuvC/YqgF family)